MKRTKNKVVSSYRKVNFYNALFRTSLRYQASHFFENSTLHGVRYIAEEGRPFLEKFMWFSCVSAGAVATVIIILSLWEKFQTNPTITGLDTDFHSWDVPFPALTLCDMDENRNDTQIDDLITDLWPDETNMDLKREFLLSLSRLNYRSLRNFSRFIDNPDLNGLTQDLKTLTSKIVKRCEDLFSDCIWKNEPYECCEGFFPIFTENGFCYTFNSRAYETKWEDKTFPKFELKYIQETDAKWSFQFSSTTEKMLVYIHNSDEVPSLDINPQHVWDQRVNKISFSVKQTYTTSDARQLSIRQRHCIYEDEVKLKIDKTMYTFTACTRQCRMETSKKLCGCIPFFYPLIEGFRYCSLKEFSCILNHLEQIKIVEKCGCELGCSNTVYEVDKLTERTDPSENNLESEFVSWPMVRYKREVLFGWVDLLVSFGGIAGLFLGFSLLSGVEIIYYFTIRACCMVYRDQKEVEELLYERKAKKIQASNLEYQRFAKQIGKDIHVGNNNIGKENKRVRPTIYNNQKEFLKQYDDISKNYNRIGPLLSKNSSRIPRHNINPPFGIEFLN